MERRRAVSSAVELFREPASHKPAAGIPGKEEVLYLQGNFEDILKRSGRAC